MSVSGKYFTYSYTHNITKDNKTKMGGRPVSKLQTGRIDDACYLNYKNVFQSVMDVKVFTHHPICFL